MNNKDLSHTEKMFSNDSSHEKDRRNMPYMEMDPHMMKPNMMGPPMGYPMYPHPGRMMQPPPGYMPQYYPPYMYEQPPQHPFYKQEQGADDFHGQNHGQPPREEKDSNIHDILKDVLKSSDNEKKPEKAE